MGTFVDLTGKRYERWLVISRASNGSSGARRWHCRCDCGNYGVVHATSLSSGNSRSCGCLKKEKTAQRRYTHGHSGNAAGKRRSPEYRAWTKMTQRCTNRNDPVYHRYGARGIIIVEQWKTFEQFYADMGPRPSDQHSLERKNGYGNYGPDNCVWATRKTQARNRPTFNHYVEYQGRSVPLTEALEMADNQVLYGTARNRLRLGWSIEDAVETPVVARDSIPPVLRQTLRNLALAANCTLAAYIARVLFDHVASKRGNI